MPTVEDRVGINSGYKSLIAITNNKYNNSECGLLREALNVVPGSSNNDDGVIDITDIFTKGKS